MKTFDKKDLITWSNRNKAVIGNEYYFADDIVDLKDKIEEGITNILASVDDNSINYLFMTTSSFYYSGILPVDAVKWQ